MPSPYAELMTYQSEVNNGGHDQYFFNTDNIGELTNALAVLPSILPEKLRENLLTAHEAYLTLAKNDTDERATAILSQCDEVFYQNEAEIERILRTYTAEGGADSK